MNRARGTLTLSIGGQDYKAHLSVNALCSLETVLDDEITSIIANLVTRGKAGNLSIRVLRAFTWAMLIDHTPAITLAQAGDLIDEATPKYMVEKIMELLPLTFPDLVKSKEEPPAGDPA